MKKINMLVALIFILSMSITAFAGEAIIVDKKDVKVELTCVETKTIYLEVTNFFLVIPVASLSTIHLAEDGKTHILRTVAGQEITGTCDSYLRGTWDLGEYSIVLTDVKSVDFARANKPQKEVIGTKQPDGFFAICTDWAGKTMEMSDIEYRLGYRKSGTYVYMGPDPGRDRVVHLKYLPIQYKELIVGIPFASIDTIKFTDNKSTEREWEPSMKVTIVDGKTLSGKLAQLGEDAPKFSGYFSNGVLIERVQQIVFNHKRDKNAPSVFPGGEILKDLDSGYTISVKTSLGNQHVLRNGYLISIDDGYLWADFKTEFEIKLGESTTVVDFSKIKSVRFLGGYKAQMITASDKTIDMLLPYNHTIWIGGNSDRFGPARIKLSRVSMLEISKTVR